MNDYNYWLNKWRECLNMSPAEQKAMTAANLSFKTEMTLEEYCSMFNLPRSAKVSEAHYGGFLNALANGKNLHAYEKAYLEIQLSRAAWKKRRAEASDIIAAIKAGAIDTLDFKPAMYAEFAGEVREALVSASFKCVEGITWRRQPCHTSV